MENVTSEIDEIISVKKFLFMLASLSSKLIAVWSHADDFLRSPSFITPLEVEKINWLSWKGWNCDAVITSESSSIFSGLRSITVNAWTLFSRFQRLILRSSDDIKFSPLAHTDMELMWKLCRLG